ncbi:MAG TPA: hypothetical protein VMR34_04450 [Candidatus Saccharimonadales bacterium]|nr:hypothetical protein [Candidatus Saccharimonadales bacterium]
MKNSKNSKFDERLDYSLLKQKKNQSKMKRLLPRIVIISVIAIVIIGGLILAYSYRKDHKTTSSKKTQTQAVLPTSTSTQTTTTQYVSNGQDLNLSFSYPSNWSVTPPTNDNPDDHTITVTSPLATITNADNKSVTGEVVIQVRSGNSTINELNSNSPVEALTSTQIAYTAPTANQDQYPYLSYIHFSNGSSASGAFEEVIITGNLSNTQGTSLNAGYFNGLDPIISANFYQCSTQSCTGSGQTPLSITTGIWQNSSIFKQVLSSFESFKLN